MGSPAAELRQRQNGRREGVETRRREWREIMGVIRVVGEAYGAEGIVKIEGKRGHRWRPEDFA